MVYCRTLPDLTFPVTEWNLGTRLVLHYSIVVSLYKCNTTRMVGRNRTTRAQYTSLQIKKKYNSKTNTHTHLIKTPHITRYLACHLTLTAQYRRHLGFALVHLREVHLIKRKPTSLKNRFQCPWIYLHIWIKLVYPSVLYYFSLQVQLFCVSCGLRSNWYLKPKATGYPSLKRKVVKYCL